MEAKDFMMSPVMDEPLFKLLPNAAATRNNISYENCNKTDNMIVSHNALDVFPCGRDPIFPDVSYNAQY